MPRLWLCLALVAAGCGSPGDPLPPSLNIPERIVDLSALQRGDRIEVRFTLPAFTTDGVALRRLRAVELRAGPALEDGFDLHRWAALAIQVPVAAVEPGPAKVSAPARDWVGREVIVGVRTAGPKGRFSEWSNLVAIPVVAPLPKPEALLAEATADGVRLSWRAGARAEMRFRIFRRGPQQQNYQPVGEVAAPPFTDSGATFGLKWEYAVEAFLKTAESEAVSETSDSAAIVPEDRFPPAPPVGLRAAPGVGSIELYWERNPEPDLRGYHLWRAAGDGPLQRLTGLADLPSFSDRNIESGKRYRYAVSAVDLRGNESAPSSPVEVTAP